LRHLTDTFCIIHLSSNESTNRLKGGNTLRIQPDFTYKFVFITAFEELDGIYTSLMVLSYSELVGLGIDIKTDLYDKLAIPTETFDTDLPILRNENIYKLRSVLDESNIIYVPEHILKETPNASIQKYLELGISIGLGIHEEIDTLTTIQGEVDQIVESMIGVSNPSVIYATKEVWMSQDEYLVIKEAREALVTRVTNHYVDKLALQQIIADLQNLLASYEDTIIQIQQP